MNRYKSFNSTGIALDGRLYAGDLNAIQDAAAALSDFAQTIDLSTLRIGDTGIQLSKFGTGEAQFSGALRSLGILRGLGGIIPGAFTTTQRDAIASGFAPYGIAVLNTTENQWQWNRGSDGARSWSPLGVLKAVANIGNASATSFRLTHNFATKDVVVMVFETAAPGRVVYPEVQIEDVNYVDIEFDVAPASGAYRVVVVA